VLDVAAVLCCLQELPPGPYLEHLRALTIWGGLALGLPPCLRRAARLEALDVSGCQKLVLLEADVGMLCTLRRLRLVALPVVNGKQQEAAAGLRGALHAGVDVVECRAGRPELALMDEQLWPHPV
jgi:hypothetical protein